MGLLREKELRLVDKWQKAVDNLWITFGETKSLAVATATGLRLGLVQNALGLPPTAELGKEEERVFRPFSIFEPLPALRV